MGLPKVLLAGPLALTLVSGALVLAPSAQAAVIPRCTGTSLVRGQGTDLVRVPTFGNGTRDWECRLGPGNTGAAVARLQIALNDCNGAAPKLSVDGSYGPQTKRAVRRAQIGFGVRPANGIYGPPTAANILWPVRGKADHCDAIG
jgi:hypothetical protein